MKHFYSIIFFLLISSFFTKSMAQSYLPIAKDSAFWFYEVNENTLAFVQRYVLFTHGDTSINGMTYQKLYFKTENNQQTKLIAAIRDNQTLKRSYAILFTHSLTGGLGLDNRCPLDTEMVLYDFSVEVNDALMNDCQESGVISDVFTDFYYDKDRTIISLSNIEQTWYEGIGSISGFFNALAQNNDYQLTDYCEGSAEDCSVQLFLNTEFIPLNEVGKIFPNPVRSSFTLQLSKTVYDAEVIISDIYGQKISCTSINGNEKIINVSHMANGVYFVEVLKEGRLVFKDKLVVAK